MDNPREILAALMRWGICVECGKTYHDGGFRGSVSGEQNLCSEKCAEKFEKWKPAYMTCNDYPTNVRAST